MILHDKCAQFENEINRLIIENEELKLVIMTEIKKLSQRLEELEEAMRDAKSL